jgi:hypothetical protein
MAALRVREQLADEMQRRSRHGLHDARSASPGVASPS